MLNDCPNCGENSLSKVKLMVREHTDSKDDDLQEGRKSYFRVEYCNHCDYRRLDGQQIRKGAFYDYLEDSIISKYGKDVPYEINLDFELLDFEELLQDIAKAKGQK